MPDNETIEQRLAALEASSQSQAEIIAQQSQENSALKKTIEALTGTKTPVVKVKPVIPTDTFQVDGKTYKFVAPVFLHNGEKVTAKDALTDETILADLVARKSGVIQAVI